MNNCSLPVVCQRHQFSTRGAETPTKRPNFKIPTEIHTSAPGSKGDATQRDSARSNKELLTTAHRQLPNRRGPMSIASTQVSSRATLSSEIDVGLKSVEPKSRIQEPQNIISSKHSDDGGTFRATEQYVSSMGNKIAFRNADNKLEISHDCHFDTDYVCDLTRSLVQFLNSKVRSPHTAQPYLQQEDELILHLRKTHNLPWKTIYHYFPHRTHNTLQTRYSKLTKDQAGNGNGCITRDSVDLIEIKSGDNEECLGSSRAFPRSSSGRDRIASHLVENCIANDDCEEEAGIGVMRVQVDHTSSINEANLSILNVESSKADVMITWQDICKNRPKFRSNRIRNHGELRLMHQFEKRRNLAAIASMTYKIGRSSTMDSDVKLCNVLVGRPYLSVAEIELIRSSMQNSCPISEEAAGWHGTVIHVDFLPSELSSIESTVDTLINSYNDDDVIMRSDESPYSRCNLDDCVRNATEAHIASLARHHVSRGPFINRSEDSIKAFLGDVKSGHKKKHPSVQLVLSKRGIQHQSSHSIQRLLRQRELGTKVRNGQRSNVASLHLLSTDVKSVTLGSMGPLANFKSTSGDVNTVAWHPGGKIFAVGSAALTDDHSMQYNESKNLLLGDVERQIVRELPDHSLLRKAPASGINSSQEMHNSQSPLLFQTISAAQFAPNGETLISTGFDKKARVWDLRGGIHSSRCVWYSDHKSRIDVLAIGNNGLFATGTQQLPVRSTPVVGELDTIFLYKYDVDGNVENGLTHSLASPLALKRPQLRFSPTCLQWGNKIYDQERYLLCGYGLLDNDYGEGHVCLWDVQASEPVGVIRGSTTVFDIAWSPSIFGRFALACTAPANVNKGTKSVVKIFDSRRLATATSTPTECSIGVGKRSHCELECPALDINDVVFNPLDENLICAGCTNGSLYLWDLRQPDQVLHHYSHGKALAELDYSRPVDVTDTGVRFVSWNHSSRLLYTGSSDGVVACWDPYRAREDSCMGKVAELDSGIMSGAFSPDFEHLLLGEVSGTVSMLEIHQPDRVPKEYESFSFTEALDARNIHLKRLEHEFESATDNVSHSESDREMAPPISTRIERSPTNELLHAKEELTQTGQAIAEGLLRCGEIEIRPAGGFPFAQAVQGPHYTGPYDSAWDSHDLRLRAISFQQSFQESTSPCELDHNEGNFTEEQRKDSKAWSNRIPGGYHKARPGITDLGESGLRCFRCGDCICSLKCKDIYECSRCKLAWRADAIGYSMVCFKSHIPIYVAPIANMSSLTQAWEPGLRYFEEPEQELSRDLTYAYQHSLWGL